MGADAYNTRLAAAVVAEEEHADGANNRRLSVPAEGLPEVLARLEAIVGTELARAVHALVLG